jgi:hypothetical protein
MSSKFCHKCRRELPFDTRVLRSEECPWCSAALHCCKNCHFWDPKAYNECREIGTEFVRDRDAPNFCSQFQFREGSAADAEAEAKRAKAKLNSLFKI